MAIAAATLVAAPVAAQSEPALYSRDSDKDVQVAAGARDPRAVWSNGTTVWVSSQHYSRVAAFTLSDGSRDSAKDFTVSNRSWVEGLWSDGTTMWVVHSGRNPAGGALTQGASVDAYTLSDGTRDTDKDFSLDAANIDPAGIWSDGTTVWTGDTQDDKLYAYTLSDGSRDSDKDISLAAANSDPGGLWSDDTTLWVADRIDQKLYGYTLSTKARDTSKDFSVSSVGLGPEVGGGPRGLWSNSTTMWVTEATTNTLYAFHMTGTSVGGI